MIRRKESSAPNPLPAVPAILKEIPNWVAWKSLNGDKPPFIVGTNFEKLASSTDPSTWTDFTTAVEKTAINGTEGVGFVIGGPAVEKNIVGFDIDGCRNPDTEELTPWADKLVDLLDSYAEVTPSKTGVRVWVIGKWPFKEHVFNLNPKAGYGEKVKIEVSNSGRYFTITGDSLYESEAAIEERDLADAYNLCLEIRAQNLPPSKSKTESASASAIGEGAKIQQESGVVTNKLELLMMGTIRSTKPFIIADGMGNSLEYPSHSEADLALCTALALKHGDSMDVIWYEYLKSPLCRDRWTDREEYFKEHTIAKAIKTAQKIRDAQTTDPKQAESKTQTNQGTTNSNSAQASETEEERIARIESRIDRTQIARPVFPRWIMEGTSIYRNLAEPVSRASGKQDVMVFMPAFVGLMNYMAGKVSIQGEEVCLNQHLGLVSPAGDYHKSSSCAVAFDYLSNAGLLTFSKLNPSGRIVEIQGGSSEGMGKTLYRANAKHAIVFYDELSKAVSKASIQNSSLASDFLTWAESGLFENYVKSTADSYSFPPKSYWFSWIWCTTERGFDRQWGILTEKESGLADRVCVILSDEKTKKGPNAAVDYSHSAETRELVNKAITKNILPYYDFNDVQERVGGLNNNKRSEGKAKAFALGFATDLGRDVVDKNCIDRGTALAQYLWDVRSYLKPIEAANPQGRLINEILKEIQRASGSMTYRDLCRGLNSSSHGDNWDRAYKWLISHDEAMDYWKPIRTKGGMQKIHMVGIVKHEDWE